MPPFEIITVLELGDACQVVCEGGTVGRCIALSGMTNENQIQTNYYCLPVDVTMYVFEYATEAAQYPTAVGIVLDLIILTGEQ